MVCIAFFFLNNAYKITLHSACAEKAELFADSYCKFSSLWIMN